MRKLISSAALALLAVLAVSSTAFADFIPIGSVAFDVDGDQQPGRLVLTNQTGDNVQDPDFPVEDFVSFLGIFLTTPGGDLHPNAELTDTNAGNPGYDFNSADYAFGTFPRSVLIGGSVANQVVSLSTGGGLWDIGGNVFMCVVNAPPCLDNGGVGDDLVDGILQGGELGIIYVEAKRHVAVPEPVTLSLLGAGVAGALIRRRRAARS
jgi:hypothetical protein